MSGSLSQRCYFHGEWKILIDQDKCIKCGKCKSVCPYDAIAKKERPCKKACGVNAITSDKLGRAYIDADKCVSCGMCMVSCPFGAISDKSQIFQLARALSEGEEIVAEVAPAFVGQFGPNINVRNFKAALEELGFSETYSYILVTKRTQEINYKALFSLKWNLIIDFDPSSDIDGMQYMYTQSTGISPWLRMLNQVDAQKKLPPSNIPYWVIANGISDNPDTISELHKMENKQGK